MQGERGISTELQITVEPNTVTLFKSALLFWQQMSETLVSSPFCLISFAFAIPAAEADLRIPWPALQCGFVWEFTIASRLQQCHLNLYRSKNCDCLIFSCELSLGYFCWNSSILFICPHRSGVAWKSSFSLLCSHPRSGLDPNSSSFITSEACTFLFFFLFLPLASLKSLSYLCHLTPELLQPFLWLSVSHPLVFQFNAVFHDDGRWSFLPFVGFVLCSFHTPRPQSTSFSAESSSLSLASLTFRKFVYI